MTASRSVGRPESQIDPKSPFAEFAKGLRKLKEDAGLSVRDLAIRAGCSPSAISVAGSGTCLPTLKMTLAYVEGCGGVPEEWVPLWQQLESARNASSGKAGKPAAIAAQPDLSDGTDPGGSIGWPLFPGPIWSRPKGPGNFVSMPSGEIVRVFMGQAVAFGRGPHVDVRVTAGLGLSRRAGLITCLRDGLWVANISHTHAIYVEFGDYRVRLPRRETDDEPSEGWLVSSGSVMVGSRAMLDEGQPLMLTVNSNQGAASTIIGAHDADGDGTLLPLYLDPMTKLFLVGLMWCRPWLITPDATVPLPRTPEIARAVIEVTGANHQLERFDTDQDFRDRLSARVADHMKVLRRKIVDRGLVAYGVRLSDEVVVHLLIEHGIITATDLGRLTDPAWRSRQEDLWWMND